MPVPADPESLARGRSVDGNRAMFAGAGPAVALLGLQELAWLLSRVPERSRVIFNLDHLGPSDDLLIWEAFVSGPAKGTGNHIDDAALAVEEFIAARSIPTPPEEDRVLNLAAAAALVTERSLPSTLVQAAIVVKPEAAGLGRLNQQLRLMREATEGGRRHPSYETALSRLPGQLLEVGVRAHIGGAMEVPGSGYDMRTVTDGAIVSTEGMRNQTALVRHESDFVWLELPPGPWLSTAMIRR